MDIKTLTDTISVSEQIQHKDLAKLAALGFKTIINNRPDGEVPFQPQSKELAAWAKKAGLTYIELPVISGQMTQKNVDDFKAILREAEEPVFAFCRTGTRSATLWARANPENLSTAQISRIGKEAGYAL